MSEWGRWYVHGDKRDEAHEIADALRGLLEGGGITCSCACTRCEHAWITHGDKLVGLQITTCNGQMPTQHDVLVNGRIVMGFKIAQGSTIRWEATGSLMEIQL